jgi:hypothetical protein
MIMGNYLRVVTVVGGSMATKSTGGMWHPTVVPENFEREEATEDEDREASRSNVAERR